MNNPKRELIEKNLTVRSTSREGLRKELIETFLIEKLGSPELQYTYRYNVETMSDGKKIYLKRPAWLNKGMDFAVHCEGFNTTPNGYDRPPTHANLIAELNNLISKSDAHKRELNDAVNMIWNCQPSQAVLKTLVKTKNDVSAERVLLLSKWLFAEQDIAYWTYSGRWMLLLAIRQELGFN